MRKVSEKPLLTLIEAGGMNDAPFPAPAATVVVTLDWNGDNENGYIGKINGVPLYQVQVLACKGRNKGRYLYFPKRLLPPAYCSLCCLGRDDVPSPETADEAKAQCAADYSNGGSAALQEILNDALATVRAAGYRVSKPRKPKVFKQGKNRVGPTFVAEFADGTMTRMSVFCSLEKLDWDRGERLSQAAYQSRWRRQQRIYTPYPIVEPVPPAIVATHFEQDGVVLARRPDNGAVS
jgi:hypothetical protein